VAAVTLLEDTMVALCAIKSNDDKSFTYFPHRVFTSLHNDENQRGKMRQKSITIWYL